MIKLGTKDLGDLAIEIADLLEGEVDDNEKSSNGRFEGELDKILERFTVIGEEKEEASNLLRRGEV